MDVPDTRTTIRTAVYEQGALRLSAPLSLPEHTQVKVAIWQVQATDDLQRAEEALLATGLVTPPDVNLERSKQPEPRLAELAEIYAVGGPLSDRIIAERDER